MMRKRHRYVEGIPNNIDGASRDVAWEQWFTEPVVIVGIVHLHEQLTGALANQRAVEGWPNLVDFVCCQHRGVDPGDQVKGTTRTRERATQFVDVGGGIDSSNI